MNTIMLPSLSLLREPWSVIFASFLVSLGTQQYLIEFKLLLSHLEAAHGHIIAVIILRLIDFGLGLGMLASTLLQTHL